MELLKVDNINVYYGSIHAIKDVSFTVNEGEVVTLIGANGAGKSTILNTVSGLLRSKTGTVDFLGQSINHVPPHKIVSMGMAHCPEGRRVFLQMSVRDNLEMGAYTQPNSGVEADIEKIYKLFPPFEGTLQAGSRYPVRRRTADVGHGPGHDVPPQATDAG